MKGNFNFLIQDDRPVVVDFHALWCAPCKIQSPILKEVVTELGDTIIQAVRRTYQASINGCIIKKLIK